MSATSLEAAWDHLIADVASDGGVIETAALIESGALGRALNGGGVATTWEIVHAEGPVKS